MATNGIDTYLVKIDQSFLHQRIFAVKVHKQMSSRRGVQAGVPQGSVLGLLLYLIYTSDIPKEEYAEKALFADLTAVYAQCRDSNIASKRLQNSLVNLCAWMNNWKIGLNKEKTQCVLYTKRLKISAPRINMNETTIPWKHEASTKVLHLINYLPGVVTLTM